MIELNSTQFHKVNPLFQNIEHSAAIVYAVLERNSPGRIFVDQPNTPTVALLYAEGAFFYIAGSGTSQALSQALVPVIFTNLLPQINDKEMVLFSFSSALRNTLDGLFREQGVIQIVRKVFKFNPDLFRAHPDRKASLPEGFDLRVMDQQMSEQYPHIKPIVDPATKRLGVCLLNGTEIASECSSIFVGKGEAEIDIHTDPKYQGKGYATLTAGAFIELCMARGLSPQWSCWPERQASIALAKKLGFEELPDVPAHYWAEDM